MNVFISYHRADTVLRVRLEKEMVRLGYRNVSIPANQTFEGWAHEAIWQHIIRNNLSLCSVVICIVGEETYSRAYVDQELHYALQGGVGTRKGIVCLVLGSPVLSAKKIRSGEPSALAQFSARLAKNLDYVVMADFSQVTKIGDLIRQAEANRTNIRIEVNNQDPPMELRQRRYFDN